MDFLDKVLRVPMAQLPFYLITLLIAFTVHEFAHAYFANKFGDPTAKLLGRVTLNPSVHFDLLGVIFLLLAGFGWARPVPVNRENFAKPRQMSIIVSAVGPLSNLLLGIFGTFVYILLLRLGVMDAITNDRLLDAIKTFFVIFTLMNFFLFLFNLIPLPPLDGYRIIEELAPRSMSGYLKQIEQWSMFIFLLILIIPVFQRNTITRLYDLAHAMYVHFAKLFLVLLGA